MGGGLESPSPRRGRGWRGWRGAGYVVAGAIRQGKDCEWILLLHCKREEREVDREERRVID